MGDDVFRRFFKRWFIHESYMNECASIDAYNASVTKLRELGEEACKKLTDEERADIKQEIESTCKPNGKG